MKMLERELDQVIKQRDALAEALRPFVNNRMFEQRFNHSGFMNATQLAERDRYIQIRNAARAVLALLAAVEGEKP
jgi:hypothetical protein